MSTTFGENYDRKSNPDASGGDDTEPQGLFSSRLRVTTATVAEVSAPPPSPTSPEPTSTKKRERDSNSGWYRVPTTTAVPFFVEICESVRKSSDPKLATATTALAWKFQRRIIILHELSKTTGSQRGRSRKPDGKLNETTRSFEVVIEYNNNNNNNKNNNNNNNEQQKQTKEKI
ncbi:hypothetical protein V1477_001933 [Vespula maculifrons]|uniref:Uncharacterized protein n=1 Tax=Vespula maculifrons TaxID=7453 RepID=A0ABD2CXJ2_VESMC